MTINRLLALSVALSACAPPGGVSGPPLVQGSGPTPIQSLVHVVRPSSTPILPIRSVISTELDFAAFWDSYGLTGSWGPRPVVDFSRFSVVVAASSTSTSGGIDIAVTGATYEAGHLSIQVRTTTPGTCPTGPLDLDLLELVLLPADLPPPAFVEVSVAERC